VIFRETELSGAWLVELEPRGDSRGFFARAWCEDELAEHGLTTRIAQCSVSWNARRGTLRGMHFQAAPHEEVKLVRCTRGAIYDVIVDLRRSSPTYTRWLGVELTAENRRTIYVPEGFAHGFQTLVDDTELFYQVSEAHAPESERGVRWDDPAFGIEWPLPHPILSEKDRAWPDFEPSKAA
jgi:dTDP-4-dehydrorhamnose 3,5-epimerase